jgi:hypothetical protein
MSHIHFFGEAGGMSFAKTLPEISRKKELQELVKKEGLANR